LYTSIRWNVLRGTALAPIFSDPFHEGLSGLLLCVDAAISGLRGLATESKKVALAGSTGLPSMKSDFDPHLDAACGLGG